MVLKKLLDELVGSIFDFGYLDGVHKRLSFVRDSAANLVGGAAPSWEVSTGLR